MVTTRTMGIAEMARALGVSHRTLRFYEAKGLLHPDREGTERRYGEADSVRLQLILKGKRLGFSLEEVRRLILAASMPPDHSAGIDATAHLSVPQIQTRLASLQEKRDRIGEAISELHGALQRAS